MESFIEVSAAGLIRHIDLKLAQMDQRRKKVGEGLHDNQIIARLNQLKTMAALVAADKEAVVNLSCTDAQLVAVFKADMLTTSLVKIKQPTEVGDIIINVREGSEPIGRKIAKELKRELRRSGR